jgi:hypothetical protein
MKKPIILCLTTLLAIAPLSFGQAKAAKSDKSAPSETAINRSGEVCLGSIQEQTG